MYGIAKKTKQKREKLERDFFHFVLPLPLLCTLLVVYYFFITVVPKKNCVISPPPIVPIPLPLLLVFREISNPLPRLFQTPQLFGTRE